MRQGTTPTHTFTLPIGTDIVSKVLIVYAQSDEEILRKTEQDCNVMGNTISVDLTQDETFLFDCGKNVQIQVRILTSDGKALASNIIVTDVDNCLTDEVLR